MAAYSIDLPIAMAVANFLFANQKLAKILVGLQ
jgi:hypothetical protein